jgi:hypothetical protein
MKIVTLAIEQITDLFTGLGKLPKVVNREPTFMEIAGYPHFENVCSNILAFYLQPNNNHGFGTLFLDVLATLINEEIVTDGQDVDVRREEITKNEKRIDLVIESDDYIIGIENKVDAELNNPFCDYSKHLKLLSEGYKKIYKILLSSRSVQPSSKLCGFYPISYEPFFLKVLANIDSYSLAVNEPHTTFLRDFIRTMQNLRQTTMLDQQRLEYFRNNQQNITALLNEVDYLRKDMRMKTQQLKDAVTLKDICNYSIASGLWKSSRNLIDVNWYIIKIDDSFWLQLDLLLTPSGWKIQFFNGNGKGSRDQVREWLKERDVEFTTSIGNPWRLAYIGKDNIHSYEAEIEDVRTWTIDMLKRLTASTADRISFCS